MGDHIQDYGVILKARKFFGMVACFCHQLSDNYVDLSDLYVDLSLIHLLENKSEKNVFLSI